ncbi:MAG: SpoIIE family protein phosphatase [Candidatus Zixiibacteriota bacterium]
MYKLVGTYGEHKVGWDLAPGKYILGRGADATLLVADSTVSRRHAAIDVSGDGSECFIEDLGSHNGTFVNGRQVSTRLQIQLGDQIMFGQTRFQLVEEGVTQSGLPRTAISESVREQSIYVPMREALKPLPSRIKDIPELLPTLFEIARSLVDSESEEFMLDKALSLISKVIPADRLAILFVSPDQKEIYTAATVLPQGKDPGLFTLSRTIVSEMLSQKNAILIGDPQTDPRFAQQQSIVVSEMKSAMAVPLLDQERILGILYVDTTNPLYRYNDEYLRLLATFGNIVASRLLNYTLQKEREERRVIEGELRRAAGIQKKLLVTEPTAIAGYQVHTFQLQSHLVGGDLYDVAVLPDGRMVFLVADVSGKGMGAALLMSNILAAFRILYRDPDFSLEKAVARVNAQLVNYSAAEDFATLFIAIASPDSNEIRYVNAGHNPPLLVKPSGEMTTLEPTGVIVGALDFDGWTPESVRMAPGDFIFAFTDGVPEATCGEEQFTDRRLREVIAKNCGASPCDIVCCLMDAIHEFVGKSRQSDDITMLLVKRV